MTEAEIMLFTVFAVYCSILVCSCCYPENRQQRRPLEFHQNIGYHYQEYYDYDMIDDDSGDDFFDDGFGSD